MQDLEKRIAAIEKKLNFEEIVVLTGSEKIVWDFISKNLRVLLEIRKYNENYYSLRGTGYGAIIDTDDNGAWTRDVDFDVLEALIELGVDVWENKKKE